MNRYVEFPRDDAGTVAADWVALTAGVLLLGTMIVYSIVDDGMSSVTSNARGALSDVEVRVDAGSAPDLNGSGGTSDSCSFPHICDSSGVRFF